MNRGDLRQLCLARVLDAKALLAAGRLDGAYYLCGYVVECALKAAIARRTQAHDFPDKDLATKAFTHKLADLLKLARITAPAAGSALELNWGTACAWNESERYTLGKSKTDADALFDAVTKPPDGALPWLQLHW